MDPVTDIQHLFVETNAKQFDVRNTNSRGNLRRLVESVRSGKLLSGNLRNPAMVPHVFLPCGGRYVLKSYRVASHVCEQKPLDCIPLFCIALRIPMSQSTNNLTADPAQQVCENCAKRGLESYIDRPEKSHILMRCPECDLFQKGALKTAVIYEDAYHDEYERRRDAKTVTAKLRLGAAKRYLRSADVKMLDIGCSVGATVNAAREFGWQASGVDISSSAIEFCRNDGLDCYEISGVELPFDDNTFDLVTHWHVIEHVEDVAVALAEWRRVLKPGGIMMLETPDSSYRKAQLMGPKYAKFWPSAHLYTFNRNNLSSILTRSGFEVLPTRLTGGFKALPAHLNIYATVYRGYRELCRSLKMCKSLEIVSRKPVEYNAAAPVKRAA